MSGIPIASLCLLRLSVSSQSGLRPRQDDLPSPEPRPVPGGPPQRIQRSHRRTRITRSLPALGPGRQTELHEQTGDVADLTALNDAAIVAAAVGMVSGDMHGM